MPPPYARPRWWWKRKYDPDVGYYVYYNATGERLGTDRFRVIAMLFLLFLLGLFLFLFLIPDLMAKVKEPTALPTTTETVTASAPATATTTVTASPTVAPAPSTLSPSPAPSLVLPADRLLGRSDFQAMCDAKFGAGRSTAVVHQVDPREPPSFWYKCDLGAGNFQGIQIQAFCPSGTQATNDHEYTNNRDQPWWDYWYCRTINTTSASPTHAYGVAQAPSRTTVGGRSLFNGTRDSRN